MSYKKMLPLVLAALLLWTVPASAAPETTLKVAVGDPEDSEMGVVGHAFKEVCGRKDGRQSGECSASTAARWATKANAFRNVQKGTLPHGHGRHRQPRALSRKKLGLLTLPYLFANIDEVVAGTNGAPAELLNKLRHQSRVPHPHVDLHGLPLHLQLPSAPSPRWPTCRA